MTSRHLLTSVEFPHEGAVLAEPGENEVEFKVVSFARMTTNLRDDSFQRQ